ncbi:MAG: transcriptional regulator [Gammaproteobacteria bacterium]|uniref:P-II family nitrogen regulator n=1 Tax=Rhodoferax sp. TaxID=50421 RepID=UPI0018233175|nr:transcriptional regulator [Rhodoferax sp.]MBU3900509.1 transcriptional regulator [Gammaproteobacteria bacterium]MBA3057586.1 transcriptional regulator [Rhodoferax sp.]MBU3996414.1 transcriptional regulator [Gammaproteobacteria bacterium]MBU4079954.1 transcriptional regulator [Gammaproteobacteria bacterium]MBU4113410.1 transcriptional regulator [Gammaproteobacteria bacterium]
MSLSPTKLVVLICEEAMESSVAPDLMAAGAKGYTVCEARGRGARGVRDARWLLSSNVRIEILCHEDVAQRLVDMLVAKYSENFGLVIYVQDAQIIRSNKF